MNAIPLVVSTIPFLNSKSFSNICRLCLQTENLFIIDEIHWERSKLKGILNQWIYFDRIRDNKFPQKVCKSCIKWAYNTDYFLKQIQRNQEILQISLGYEQLGASKKENELENVKKKTKIFLEIPQEEVVIKIEDHDYCEADNDSSVLEEKKYKDLFKTEPEQSNEVITYPLSEEVPSNALGFELKDEKNDYIIEILPENDTASTPSVAADDEAVVEENDQATKIQGQIYLECFNYFCGACKQGFKTDKELLHHKKFIKSHFHGGCIFICHPCKFKTNERFRFQVHMDRHQNIKSQQCSTCGKMFRVVGDLRKHINKIHLNVRKPKCKFCYKIFANKESCEEHEKSHQDIVYICSFCGESFKVWEKWFAHEKGHKQNKSNRTRVGKRAPTNNKPIQTPCDLCEEILASKAQLITHRKNIHNQSHFICQTCGLKTKYIQTYEMHMTTHKGLRKLHQCNYCEKSFVDVKWYKNHLKLHTNETKHNCPYCSKPCIDKRNLTTHLRVHTGEKNYKCTLCLKVFAASENLKLHLKTHAGPPTFKCLLCPRAFYMNYMLQRHIKKKHNT